MIKRENFLQWSLHMSELLDDFRFFKEFCQSFLRWSIKVFLSTRYVFNHFVCTSEFTSLTIQTIQRFQGGLTDAKFTEIHHATLPLPRLAWNLWIVISRIQIYYKLYSKMKIIIKTYLVDLYTLWSITLDKWQCTVFNITTFESGFGILQVKQGLPILTLMQ